MNSTKPSMIDMKPKDAIKVNIIELDKSGKDSEEELLPEDGLRDISPSLVKKIQITEDELLILFRVKIRLG